MDKSAEFEEDGILRTHQTSPEGEALKHHDNFVQLRIFSINFL